MTNQSNEAAERSAHVTRNTEKTEDTRQGFWVIIEDAEGRLLRYWWTRMEGGVPFGARLRLSTSPPTGGTPP